MVLIAKGNKRGFAVIRSPFAIIRNIGHKVNIIGVTKNIVLSGKIATVRER